MLRHEVLQMTGDSGSDFLQPISGRDAAAIGAAALGAMTAGHGDALGQVASKVCQFPPADHR